MYTRNLQKAPKNLIKDGKPQFGSYNEPPSTLDIRGVKYPYGVLPLPCFITNLRIRSNFSFVFSTEEYIGTFDLLDAKFFGFTEVNIWNKKTEQRYSYRNLMGLHRRLVPKNLEKAICVTHSKRRYIRIAWDKNKDRFSVVFHLKGDDVRPSFMGTFVSTFNDKTATLTSVLPAPTMRRCYVSYQRPVALEGGVFVSHDDKAMPFFMPKPTQSLIVSTRAYYQIRILKNLINGIGKSKDNREVVFRLADSSFLPANKDTYNENVLFVENELTPLPPVRVTYPYGLMKKWVIQDTESMVDLTFTPASGSKRLVSAFVLHALYYTFYGTFDGVLITKDGESIVLKDFPGIVKHQRMRL